MSRGTAATLALIVSLLISAMPAQAGLNLTDEQIRKELIAQSIQSYPGNCPCPYNTDRAGRSCGKRSAYSKPGGYAPLCYPADVTPEMIQQYRLGMSDE